MARRSRSQSDALDCTSDCSSESHAVLILSVAHLGNVRLLQHCSTLCANYLRIRDSLGRTALHVAASRGHLKLVRWLLEKKVSPNQTDLESRWSALHRSIFYGQLGAAALLVRAGGDLKLRDNDGLTPLSLLNQDRRLFKSALSVGQVSVYMWGSNSNLTLGHDHSRSYPEKLELPHNLIVNQVVLCKFHSVFLTECGKVLTCGHGLGGRLGHDSEQSLVVPCAVKVGISVGIAAARSHTVILTKSGGVYTCGLNDAHQLGHGSNPSTAPPSCLLPKHIKALKNKTVIGVGAGRYHTAVCTTSEVYTMGKNLGQLGYEKTYDTQIAPRAVPGVNLGPGDVITHLSASDAATACLTKRCRIFVCTSSSVKTIRWGFLEKSICLQFSVCASLSDLDYLRKVETESTKVLMLDTSHDLWYWEPTVKGSLPNYLPGLSRLKVLQFSLGRNLSIVTEQGEVFRGSASLSKGPLHLARLPHIQNARAIFSDFKSVNFTFVQQVYTAPRLPHLSPTSLPSDLTALLEEACLPGSVSDLEIEAGGQVFACHKFIVGSVGPEAHSLVNSAQQGTLSVKCDNPSVFEALLHYMYGNGIELLSPSSRRHNPHSSSHVGGPLASGSSSALSESSAASVDPDTTPDTSFNISHDENDLTDLYDQFASSEGYTDLQLTELQPPVRFGGSTPKKKSPSLFRGVVSKVGDEVPHRSLQLVDVRADLKALGQLAALFGVSSLQNSVEDLLSSQRALSNHLVLESPTPVLKPGSLPQYSDLVLVSEEGISHPTHRCVLVARSEYFRSMLLMGWRESSDTVKSLPLPVSEAVLRAVLEFIYTDECPAVNGVGNVEWVVNVLVIADQLLLTRLKDLCEHALASSLSLRNVSEILELAEAYSASQLKSSCLQFISANAAALLEERLLDSLDVSLLEELSVAYLQMAPSLSERIIKFAEPSTQDLPESYFLEDPNSDGSKVTSDEEFHSPVTSHESITPRGSNSTSGRKKRRRKTSQSEWRRPDPPSPNKTPPPPSPVENAPSLVCDEDTPRSSIQGVAAPPSPPAGSVWTEKLSRSAKRASGKARTRLANKFGTGSNGVVTPGSNGVTASVNSRVAGSRSKDSGSPGNSTRNEVSSTVNGLVTNGGVRGSSHEEKTVKGAWAQLSISNGGSLRAIMAKEEELERSKQQSRHKSPPPATMATSPAIPISHGNQGSPVQSPDSQSPSVNPWKSEAASSPPVSLRELMMEAEAAQRREKLLSQQRQTRADDRVTGHQPVKVPHQQVSFASIVRAQELEQDKSRLRAQKPLRLIQIEEKAILELEEAYSARGNPDEYITIVPLVNSNGYIHRTSHDSPWAVRQSV